jgi:hypothetical protein
MNNIFSIFKKNPMMGIQIMKQMNPMFLNQCFKILEEDKKNNKKINNFKNNIDKAIPEYETIDTETNPLNKYIENAINFSYTTKLEILKQYNLYPQKFLNIFEILSSPGLLPNNQPSSNDYKYILCLIGKILYNYGIIVGIYKESNIKDRIDLSSIQFIFSGLINKKKFKLKFNVNEDTIICLIHDLNFRKQFINKWKNIISQKLNINKDLIIFTNPRKEEDNNFFFDLAFNPNIGIINENYIRNNLIHGEIADCQMVPLIEGCRLSPSIFDSRFNKYYNNIRNNLIRGGEEYIQPLSWTTYGINITGKYDFGDNTWLGNNNNNGEFAVAYYGINNLFQNLNMVQNIMNLMGNFESGRTFIDVNDIRSPGQKCNIGGYFYKNPIHAENASDAINIGGFEYKIMFMCRVKASAIRQPENFPDCWILSPTPDEVRPYKILLKKIPISPLAIASQQEIKVSFGSPSPLFLQIIQNKDESYFNNNNTNMSNYDYVLKEYTGCGAANLNNYLRNLQTMFPDNMLNSFAWCLHKAITQNNQNVPNGVVVYRGVKVKIPNNIGIGKNIYFPEFLSTSKDINVAKSFAGSGTLMIIFIQNNGVNGKKVYCRDVENISVFSFEKEIVLTAFCKFKVTNMKRSANLDELYLTCVGSYF